ncbi:MAG: hypothetical protein E7321_05925 [Clostridiales bacterium]|nr:hypothetical protein [Clostridiales bacterium]
MKRILVFLLVLALLPCMAIAQTISMEEQGLTFNFPESWLVVSPQLAAVYAPRLEGHGIDGDALSQELEEQGVLSRAYRADFRQSMSVITRSDELSAEIFDSANISEEQRRELRRMAENNRIWETTGCRAQDVEWHKENGEYWLYIHYVKTFSDEIVGRGLRYVTVKNGMYVMLDWQIDSGRFGNRDIASFRARTHDLAVEKIANAPTPVVRLTAEIPQETTVSDLIITGKATANATLVAQAPDAMGEMQLLSVGQAGSGGSFSLLVPLEEEGTFDILLTASMDGMTEASVTGTVTYSAKTLPVSLGGIEDGGVHTVTTDKTVISGQTLAGTQMQMVTPFGVSKKRAGNDGSFSFELTTDSAHEYRYTLILDKDGFDQRRYPFTLVRVMTDDQEKAAVRKTAEKISYRQLQRDLGEDRGKVMSLYGPVTEVSGSGSAYYIRMQFNKGADGTWYNPVIIVAKEDMGAKVGDMITVVCEVSGVFEEQDSQGEPVMVPRFDLLFVDKVE